MRFPSLCTDNCNFSYAAIFIDSINSIHATIAFFMYFSIYYLPFSIYNFPAIKIKLSNTIF